MKNARIDGVVCPCITPFHRDGTVDEVAFRSYLEFLAEKVDWVSIGAIYGSGILMRDEQRKLIFEIASDVTRGKAKLSVFVGSTNTETTVNLTAYANEIDADAISCVTPFYYRQVGEALYGHYRAILDATEIPVYIYDSPIYAGNNVSLEVVERLAADGLAGIITGAATNGIEHLYSYIRKISQKNFDVLSIRDGLALPAMIMGSPGFESGVANFFPELVIGLFNAIKEKNFELASQLQERVLKLRDISHSYSKNIPTLHALIELRGYSVGDVKAPFFLLSSEEKADLRSKLKKLSFETPFDL